MRQRASGRWAQGLRLVALMLLLVGCLAKGVTTAKAAYQLSSMTPQSVAILVPAGEDAQDVRDDGSLAKMLPCIGAYQLGPLAVAAEIGLPRLVAQLIYLQPEHVLPPGWRAQPLDRPPRLFA